jgi:hypothetical protein
MLDALLGQLADRVADRVAARLRAQQPQDQWIPMRNCGVPLKTAKHAAKAGAIEWRKVGRALFVKRSSVEAWIANRPEPKAASESERERLLRLATAPRRRRAAA